jgi:hypothetical protein
MSDLLKTSLQRLIQVAVGALAGWLVSKGQLPQGQEQSFIGAAFFLAAWLVDTFVVHKQKVDAAVAGGTAVASVSSDAFTTGAVKEIVRGVPK